MTAAFLREDNMPTRDELIKNAATAAAERVDAESVGLDPITVITILTEVLPALIACFRRNDESDPQEVHETVKAQCSTPRGRKALKNRMTTRIRRQQRAQGKHLNKDAAEELAEAIIEESLAQQSEVVSSLCSAISEQEFCS